MRGAVAALAVGDHFLVWRHPGAFVHRAQFVRRPEVAMRREVLRPLDVHRPGDRTASSRADRGAVILAVVSRVEDHGFSLPERGMHVTPCRARPWALLLFPLALRRRPGVAGDL